MCNCEHCLAVQVHPTKYEDCRQSVRALFGLLQHKISSADILTKKAFENGITVMYALGGSTNAVLHLLALAVEAEVTNTSLFSLIYHEWI